MADRAEMSSTDRASGMDENQSTTDSSSICLVPRYNFVGTAGHQCSRQACLTISDEEIETQVHDAKAATARELQVNVTLQFHMDSSVWDVIQKEVMDWRHSSWTSMHLPRDMMCMLASTYPFSQQLLRYHADAIDVFRLHPIPSFLECKGSNRDPRP